MSVTLGDRLVAATPATQIHQTRTLPLETQCSVQSHWGPCLMAESLLAKYRFPVKIEIVPLTSVDREHSLGINPRPDGTIVKDAVTRYFVDMAKPNYDRFPRPVLVRLGNGMYSTLSGNQRITAAIKAKFEYIEAYVLEEGTYTPDLLKRFARDANRTHGMPPTYNECLQFAKELCENKVPATDAADASGVKVEDLYASLHADAIHAKLVAMEVIKADSAVFTDEMLASLYCFRDEHETLYALAYAVVTGSLNGRQLDAMIKEVSKHAEVQVRLSVAEALSEKYANEEPGSLAESRTKKKRSRDEIAFDEFMKACRMFDKLNDKYESRMSSYGSMGGMNMAQINTMDSAIRRVHATCERLMNKNASPVTS